MAGLQLAQQFVHPSLELVGLTAQDGGASFRYEGRPIQSVEPWIIKAFQYHLLNAVQNLCAHLMCELNVVFHLNVSPVEQFLRQQ